MNHGLKVNGNILEITLPEEVHIDRVMVNRQIFSQRMQVCKSCKYHGLEGHEEPCVSCEVGNSNYVAVEERRKGEWIELDDDRISGRCSVCGWEAHLYEDDVVGMDYCPNCGARLLEGEQK